MGLPAARALKDTGAHSAPIAVGSFDVFINNFPAARKGDPIPCPVLLPTPHVAGFITMGSTTVNINGKPAARMGDLTGCSVPPPPTPPFLPPGVVIPPPPAIPGTVLTGSSDVLIGG